MERRYWDQCTLDHLKTIDQKWGIERVILSSVKDLPRPLIRQFSTYSLYIELDADTPLPIKNNYRTPKTLGRDRLAAVTGAFALFPGQNSLVIDAGTCITYDLLTKEGIFAGGNISPGLKMRFQAMHSFTAKLPMVAKGTIRSIIGTSTKSALRVGAQWGAILEMQGFIDLFSDQFGSINVLLTGGDANFFAKKLKSQIFVNQNLVLTGLNKILSHNVQLLE